MVQGAVGWTAANSDAGSNVLSTCRESSGLSGGGEVSGAHLCTWAFQTKQKGARSSGDGLRQMRVLGAMCPAPAEKAAAGRRQRGAWRKPVHRQVHIEQDKITIALCCGRY